MPDSPSLSWPRRLAMHVRFMWYLKALGTMGFIAVFFGAYFAVLRHPFGVPVAMPLTWLDHQIAFTPAALPLYLSLWFYVSLAPAVLDSLRALTVFGLWISLLCLAALAVFWLFPTQTPVFDIPWGAYPQLAQIKGLDAAGNAFPSLHVASAVFCAIWLHRSLQRLQVPALLRVANVLHCAAIVWSTVAVRQHVVLDVVGGLALGAGFAVLSLRHADADTARLTPATA